MQACDARIQRPTPGSREEGLAALARLAVALAHALVGGVLHGEGGRLGRAKQLPLRLAQRLRVRVRVRVSG